MADNVLDQARARLDGGNKWCKQRLYDKHGRACLVGAINEVSSHDIKLPHVEGVDCACERSVAAAVLNDVIWEQYPQRSNIFFHSVSYFNDHPDTTWADVEAVLDKAARRLDEQL